MTDEWFGDCANENSPFGNDGGSDTLSFLRDWRKEHPRAKGSGEVTLHVLASDSPSDERNRLPYPAGVTRTGPPSRTGRDLPITRSNSGYGVTAGPYEIRREAPY